MTSMRPVSDDYYDLLGVPRFATETELRQAWHRLAVLWHPDHAGAEAAPTFRKLAAAYATLSDPTTRAAYDREHPARVVATHAPPAERHDRPDWPAGSYARAPAVMLSRITGSLQSLMARGIAQHVEPNVIDLHLDETESAEGGMTMISMRVDLHCPDCSAAAPPTSATQREPEPPCPRCGGSRKVQELYSAWLAIRPGLPDGTRITPSVTLPGMIETPTFRIRTRR
jgi:DnaJ-class molecular chaperone